MSKLLRDFEAFLGNDTHYIFDDFYHYITGDAFTTVAAGTNTCADTDAAGGELLLTCSAEDEAQSYCKGTHEVYKFATDKPLFFATKVKPATKTILKGNWIIGLKDAVAGDSIQDAGAGPAASYSGAVFYKADGATVWGCESSLAGTQTTVATAHTVGNNAYDILAISTIPLTSTLTEVHFFSADVQTDGSYSLAEVGKTSSGETFFAQTLTHTSATEMQVCFGAKAGGTTENCRLFVDWVYAAQRR